MHVLVWSGSSRDSPCTAKQNQDVNVCPRCLFYVRPATTAALATASGTRKLTSHPQYIEFSSALFPELTPSPVRQDKHNWVMISIFFVELLAGVIMAIVVLWLMVFRRPELHQVRPYPALKHAVRQILD